MTDRFEPRYSQYIDEVCEIRTKCCHVVGTLVETGLKASIFKERWTAAEQSVELYKTELARMSKELQKAKSFQFRYKYIKEVLEQDRSITEEQVANARSQAGVEATPVQAAWLEKHTEAFKEIETAEKKLKDKCSTRIKALKQEAHAEAKKVDCIRNGGDGDIRHLSNSDNDDEPLPKKKQRVQLKWTNGAGKGDKSKGSTKGADKADKPKKISVATGRNRFIATQSEAYAEAKKRGDEDALNFFTWASSRWQGLDAEAKKPFNDAWEEEKRARGIVTKKPAASRAKSTQGAPGKDDHLAPSKKRKGESSASGPAPSLGDAKETVARAQSSSVTAPKKDKAKEKDKANGVDAPHVANGKKVAVLNVDDDEVEEEEEEKHMDTEEDEEEEVEGGDSDDEEREENEGGDSDEEADKVTGPDEEEEEEEKGVAPADEDSD